MSGLVNGSFTIPQVLESGSYPDRASTYLLFGLLLHSEITLPELHEVEAMRPPDVFIRKVKAVSARHNPSFSDDLLEIAGDGVTLRLEGVTFSIEEGRSIEVALDGRDLLDVRAYLLGSVMAALLYQRESYALHGNLVIAGAKTVAVIGPSGAGKSTLAALLAQRGLGVWGDDLCSIDMMRGIPTVSPSIPRIKMWQEGLHALGMDTDGLTRVYSDADKFALSLQTPPTSESLRRLSAIYVLKRSPDNSTTLTELEPRHAIAAIISNAFRWKLAVLMNKAATLIGQACTIAEKCAVYEFSRPWEVTALHDSTAQLVSHIEGLPSDLFPEDRVDGLGI